MHRNSLLLFEKYAQKYFEPNMRVLEIGGRTHSSRFNQSTSHIPIRWETLDLVAGPGVSWIAKRDYAYPFEDGEFDIVFSANVAEHVPRIWLWMRELARICVPGGIVITINPVNWPYHESPVDCWRMYPAAMHALYNDAGLSVEISRAESLEYASTRLLLSADSWISLLLDARRRIFSSHAPLFAIDTITIGKKMQMQIGAP